MRQRRPSYNSIYPERVRAGRILKKAIASGEIVRPRFCSACEWGSKTCGHHEDYSKPLEVIWVCNSCHMKIHQFKRMGRTIEDAIDAIRNPLGWTVIKYGSARGAWKTTTNFRSIQRWLTRRAVFSRPAKALDASQTPGRGSSL